MNRETLEKALQSVHQQFTDTILKMPDHEVEAVLEKAASLCMEELQKVKYSLTAIRYSKVVNQSVKERLAQVMMHVSSMRQLLNIRDGTSNDSATSAPSMPASKPSSNISESSPIAAAESKTPSAS